MRRIISIVVTIAIIYSILMGSVYAEPESAVKFKDVKESDWFAEAVSKMSTKKIIDGMPGGSFNPKGEVTRAQFVKMLVQAMDYQKIDSISFDDIKPLADRKAHWASVYIETALRNGVISKEELGNNFFPDIPLTRKDMAIMMFRALNLTPSEGENPFADIAEANGNFTKLYEEYLIRGNIISGKVLFEAEALSTRAQAVVVISRMLDYKANPVEFKQKEELNKKLRNGTYTKEDLALKAKLELARQAEDKEYIPEPIIKVEYNPNKYVYALATLVNADDYGSDTTFKFVSTNYSDLNRWGSSNYYGKYVESDMTRPFTPREVKVSFLAIPKHNAKLVNGDIVFYDFNFPVGKKLKYKITISRGNATKQIDFVFAIQ